MKYTKLLSMFLLLASLAACKKDHDDVEPIALSLKVSFANDLQLYGFPLGNAEIKLTNLSNGQVNTAKTDEAGVAKFESLLPGTYDVDASLTLSAEQYTSLTGSASAEEVVFNGNIKGKQFFSSATEVAIELDRGRVGDWVLKQIYYVGSHTSNGAIFRDQFVEIYNNSNEVLYADSLYFAQIYGTPTTTQDQSKGYYLPSGQFDWTKSIGMNNSKANTDYIYAKTVFMIPGNGKSHPVQPGQSIIIASTAINHKSPYTGADGKSVTVKMPELTVDLSNADFEVYLGNYPGINPLASDLNTAVPDLAVISTGGNRDLVLDAVGRQAFVIFKSKVVITNYSSHPSPAETVLKNDTDLYMQLPNNIIIDAVETQNSSPTSKYPKKLNTQLDAGEAFATNGSYSSQSIIRKTSRTVDGRRILKDTNNSGNDFTVLVKANPDKTAFAD